MYSIGNGSLLFVTVTLGFIGMVTGVPDVPAVQARHRRPLHVGANSSSSWSATSARADALMLATRVGAGIAAEIGSMVVTEQVDALRMSGVEPIDYLIVPRFLAQHRHDGRAVVWSPAPSRAWPAR